MEADVGELEKEPPCFNKSSTARDYTLKDAECSPEQQALADNTVNARDGTTARQPQRMTLNVERIIILFSILNVMMLALNITTSICYFEEASTDHIKYSPPLCVKCDNLRTSPEEKWANIKRQENSSLCCVKGQEHVSTLVLKFTKHWLKKNVAEENRHFKNCGSEEKRKAKPLIKLAGLNNKQPVSDWGHHHRVMWDPRSDSAVIDSLSSIAFNEKHSTIEIMKSGLYFVYSQVVFEHEFANITPGHPVVYTHRVVRANPNDKREYDDVIMTSIQTPCRTNETFHEETSYIGGAFQMQRGDTLSVKVNRRLRISAQAHMNVFGVYMM